LAIVFFCLASHSNSDTWGQLSEAREGEKVKIEVVIEDYQ
jgi:hypothetical protein